MKIKSALQDIFVFLVLIQMSLGDPSTWRSGKPDGLPQLVGLNVECGREDMTIHLHFDMPYDGSIYSKSAGQGERCIHVAAQSHITDATFTVEYESCGTRSDPKGKYYENTIIIQYDDDVLEAWDIAKKIRCEWHDGYEKSAYKQPITISDLDVVEMNFQGDDVDCWLEIQDGKGPWSSKVDGLVPLGSPLTLVVAIQDTEGHFDMRVKSCKAHDGRRPTPVHLTDEDGCVLRPKMMSPFVKTRDTKGTATIVAYSHFYAFKFPETVEVNVQCTVEICRHGCPEVCTQGRDPDTGKKPAVYVGSPSPTDADEIPTYRDSYPFSSIITSKPGRNNSSNYNISKSGSSHSVEILSDNKTSDHDPIEDSSNSMHSFVHHKYPHGLFDVLHAEDRVDENIDEYNPYLDKTNYDSSFAENKAELDYSHAPEFLKDIYGKGKGFPSQNATESNALLVQNTEPTEEQHRSELLVDDDKYSTEPNDQAQNQQYSTLHKTILNVLNKNHSSVIPSTESNEKQHIQDYFASTISSLPTGINENYNTDLSNATRDGIQMPYNVDQNLYQDQKKIVEEMALNEKKMQDDIISDEVTDYSEDLTENKSGEMLSDYYDSLSNAKKISSTSSEEEEYEKHFKVSGYNDYGIKNPVEPRRPMKNYRTSHSPKQMAYHDHRPFKPLYPAPPLTLYNGIPLHYYQHKTNIEFFDRDGFQYIQNHPPSYHPESLRYQVRQSGRHRGRREIGDKEQLGLKQTFRVIAPIDLAFVTKDKEDDLYIGRQEAASPGMCMASTSLAAGLGLLILANICIICVVVFLAHHYCAQKKSKMKTIELFSKDISS